MVIQLIKRSERLTQNQKQRRDEFYQLSNDSKRLSDEMASLRAQLAVAMKFNVTGK